MRSPVPIVRDRRYYYYNKRRPQEKEDNQQQPLQSIHIARKRAVTEEVLAWEEEEAWVFRAKECKLESIRPTKSTTNRCTSMIVGVRRVNKQQAENYKLLNRDELSRSRQW
jgi:hypothetical protein